MTAQGEDPIVVSALADLREWSEALPSYDVDAGAVRHVELVREGATATATAGSSALARAVSRGWWIAGASAAIVFGLLGAWPHEREHVPTVAAATTATEHAEPPVEHPVAAPVVASRAAAPSRAAEPSETPEPTATVVPETRPAPVRTAKRKSIAAAPRVDAPREEPPHADADTDALERELAIVRRMRRALRDDPADVLVLAEQADREVGRGVFTEERAALHVLALARLDDARTPDAAAAFLRTYARGPFAARVARLRTREAMDAEAQ